MESSSNSDTPTSLSREDWGLIAACRRPTSKGTQDSHIYLSHQDISPSIAKNFNNTHVIQALRTQREDVSMTDVLLSVHNHDRWKMTQARWNCRHEWQSREDILSVGVLLWRVGFDRKVGALSLRLQLGLGGRVSWRKDWPDDGNVAWKERNTAKERGKI